MKICLLLKCLYFKVKSIYVRSGKSGKLPFCLSLAVKAKQEKKAPK